MKKRFNTRGQGWHLAAASILNTANAEDLQVGVEIPLTGSLARVGSGMLEGITVAAEVFNSKNPKNKIKLVTIDDESAPAKAIAAVEKLSGQGVLAITGGYGSNNIAPAADAAAKAGLVYVTSGGVDDSLVNKIVLVWPTAAATGKMNYPAVPW